MTASDYDAQPLELLRRSARANHLERRAEPPADRGGDRGHAGRVDPAREERPDLDVGDQLLRDGPLQLLPVLFQPGNLGGQGAPVQLPELAVFI